MIRSYDGKRGITLIEILTAGAIFALAMVALMNLFGIGLRVFSEIDTMIFHHEEGIRTMDILKKELSSSNPFIYGWLAKKNFEFDKVWEFDLLGEETSANFGRLNQAFKSDTDDTLDISKLEEEDFYLGSDPSRPYVENWEEYGLDGLTIMEWWNNGWEWKDFMEAAHIQKWRNWWPSMESLLWSDVGIIGEKGFYFPSLEMGRRKADFQAICLYYSPGPEDDPDIGGMIRLFLSKPNNRVGWAIIAEGIKDFNLEYLDKDEKGIFGILPGNEVSILPPCAIKSINIDFSTVQGRLFSGKFRLAVKNM